MSLVRLAMPDDGALGVCVSLVCELLLLLIPYHELRFTGCAQLLSLLACCCFLTLLSFPLLTACLFVILQALLPLTLRPRGDGVLDCPFLDDPQIALSCQQLISLEYRKGVPGRADSYADLPCQVPEADIDHVSVCVVVA